MRYKPFRLAFVDLGAHARVMGEWRRKLVKNDSAVERRRYEMRMFTLTEFGLMAGVVVRHNHYPRVVVGPKDEIVMGRKDYPDGLKGPYPEAHSPEGREDALARWAALGVNCPHLGEVWEYRDLMSPWYWDPEGEPGGIWQSPDRARRNRAATEGCPICGRPWAGITPHAVVHADASLKDGVDLRRRGDKEGWVLLKHHNPGKDSRALVMVDMASVATDISLPDDPSKHPEVVVRDTTSGAAVPRQAILLSPGREFRLILRVGEREEEMAVRMQREGPDVVVTPRESAATVEARKAKAEARAAKEAVWEKALRQVREGVRA